MKTVGDDFSTVFLYIKFQIKNESNVLQNEKEVNDIHTIARGMDKNYPISL